MTLTFISFETGPVSARYPLRVMGKPLQTLDSGFGLRQATVAKHTFRAVLALDVILVPECAGNVPLKATDMGIEDFLN
jgi:hypothetical protein